MLIRIPRRRRPRHSQGVRQEADQHTCKTPGVSYTSPCTSPTSANYVLPRTKNNVRNFPENAKVVYRCFCITEPVSREASVSQWCSNFCIRASPYSRDKTRPVAKTIRRNFHFVKSQNNGLAVFFIQIKYLWRHWLCT